MMYSALITVCMIYTHACASLNLGPNTVVVSTELSGILRQIDPVTGTTLSSVQLRTQSGANINNVFAMTEVAGDLYVSTGDYAGRVNPATGMVVPLYVTFSGGLGNRGDFLLGQGSFTINTRTIEGVLVTSVDVDGQTAGVPAEVSDWFRDVDWTGQRYGMLWDTHSNPSYIEVFEFNDAGAYVTNTVQYFRSALYNANGFDIDLTGNQFWVAFNRADDFNSQVRSYQWNNPNATRILTLPFGGASDIVYIVPTPSGAAVLFGAGLLGGRRRR